MSALIPVRSRMYRPNVKLSWSPGRTSVLNVTAVLLLFVAFWFIASTPSKETTSLTLSTAAASAANPELKADFVSASRRLGYVTVVGETQNLSSSSLTNVEAVVELLDRRGAIIAVESALIGLKQLAPSESTPFSVTLRDAAHAATFRVRFRTFMGRSIGSTVSVQ